MSHIQTNRDWVRTLTFDELFQLFTDGLIVREVGGTDPGVLLKVRVSPFDRRKYDEWLNKPQKYVLAELI